MQKKTLKTYNAEKLYAKQILGLEMLNMILKTHAKKISREIS
jgi:hypothetical protein